MAPVLNILEEAAFWAALFLLVIRPLSERMTTFFVDRCDARAQLMNKESKILSNQFDESKMFAAVGIQHAMAALMVFYGMSTQNFGWVRSGILSEWSFQLVDLIHTWFRIGAFEHVKDTWRGAMAEHHLAGLTSGIAIVYCEMFDNVHVQRIVFTMMFFSGSFLCVLFIMRNISNAQGRTDIALVITQIELFFGLIICRFIIFPLEAMKLAWSIYKASPLLAFLIFACSVTMSLFNLRMLKPKLSMITKLKTSSKQDNVKHEDQVQNLKEKTISSSRLLTRRSSSNISSGRKLAIQTQRS